jgi:hypothetical protein
VYAAVAPELLTEEGHLVAALLAAGDGALLSHGTAAWRWRIIPAPPSGQHERPHQADSDDDRDLWLRRHGHVVRRSGTGQIEGRPDEVIADVLAARGQAAAGAPLRLL